MSGIIIESDYCIGNHVLKAPEPLFPGDEYQWVLTEQPFGANGEVVDNGPTAVLQAPVSGCYSVELLITRTEGDGLPSSGYGCLYLGCPKGIIAGENIDVLIECGGTIIDQVITGPVTGQSQAGEYLVLTTNNTTQNGGAPGQVSITVTCECIDEDGNPVIVTKTCVVEVIQTDLEPYLNWQASDRKCIETVNCQTVCLSCDESICVSECGPDCDEGFFTGVSKECPPDGPPISKDKPVPLTRAFLTGTKQIVAPNLGLPFDDCPDCEDGKFYCFEHKPVFCWNNVCSCPGWEINGGGLFGTSPLDACCGNGRQWIGGGTMTGTGPNTPQVSCAIVWGHNIKDGEISTFPPIDQMGSTGTIALCQDNACLPGFTRPIVLNLEAQDTNTVQMNISGDTVDGGPIRINNIFMGDKFFLEDDRLPDGFINPHNGTDFKHIIKENDCGFPISTEVERIKKTVTLDLDCLSEGWLKTQWRSYMRYLSDGNEVYFGWSRNGCPDDLFRGYMTQQQEGSMYDQIWQSLSFTFEGYCTQPQSKLLVPSGVAA